MGDRGWGRGGFGSEGVQMVVVGVWVGTEGGCGLGREVIVF